MECGWTSSGDIIIHTLKFKQNSSMSMFVKIRRKCGAYYEWTLTLCPSDTFNLFSHQVSGPVIFLSWIVKCQHEELSGWNVHAYFLWKWQIQVNRNIYSHKTKLWHIYTTNAYLKRFTSRLQIVIWSFTPSQPRWVISGRTRFQSPVWLKLTKTLTALKLAT